MTGITYSDSTPAVTYNYDTVSPYGKGHLASISNSNSTTNFTSYDPLGRVTASNQTTGVFSGLGFAYTYNLLGSLTSETLPTGRKVTTGYDGAGRPYSVTGLLAGTTKNYVTQTAYWPHGAPYYFNCGNNVWSAVSYNNRLQLTESYEALNNQNDPAHMLFVSCPNWGVNANNYGTYDICPHAATTTDNATLQGYTEYHGGPTHSGAYLTFNQTFGYDNVNRVTSASDSGTGVAGSGWARAFSYDNYGNMWVSSHSAAGPWSGITPIANVFDVSMRKRTR